MIRKNPAQELVKWDIGVWIQIVSYSSKKVQWKRHAALNPPGPQRHMH
jgi:hypothetical protein